MRDGAEDFLKLLKRLVLHGVGNVDISLQCRCNVPMTQPLLYNLWGYAVLYEDGCVRVAKGVEIILYPKFVAYNPRRTS